MSLERWALMGATLVLLAVGSAAFNRWIDALSDADPHHGYSAWLVVVGVTYTSLGSAVMMGLLLGWWPAVAGLVVLFACFVAAGVPMILGDMQRAGRRRRDAAARREE